MTEDQDNDRWVAHRREGWTVESAERRRPVSVHDDFDDARAALHDDVTATDTPGDAALPQPSNEPPDDGERWAGYVVDVACLRKYPAAEYGTRASEHPTECALMGHCIESGYGLVDDTGTVHLVDTHATGQVVDALTSTDQERGLRLIVERRMEDGEMVTSHVAVAPADGDR